MIALARKTLLHEWRRFLPAVFALGFSGVLLTVQAALVLGIFESAALYVSASSADIWAGYPGTQSVSFGRAVSPDVEMRLRSDADVADVEPYLWVEGDWHAAGSHGGGVSVYVSGIRTQAEGMLFSELLPRGLRQRLDEPGAVIVDRADLDQLGVAIGGSGNIGNQPVTVIAALPGLRALGGVNVLASIDTARRIAGHDAPAGATYYVARVRPGADADAVRQRLRPDAAFGPFEAWTAEQFARRSQHYWLFGTGAGVAVLFMAVIVCVVGAVVTSQSLMGVVAGSSREYAVLHALGASMAALGRVVVEQACWVGGLGLLMAALMSAALLALAGTQDVPVAMSLKVSLLCGAIVAVLALVSGLLAMRGLLRADPAELLR
ncbi:ABC transporter permease [Xylophilus rhododendri]|uniref:ABC transporter permease n=1 Tax=Xylophilus rhododendri TaxID=2697032 RepID=A0A857JA15_9BURK|nr:ABC transporter permease [Xylophilus rhododendri]QHI99585.1 ABC transporter permease [Xylophilus rhododendri]